MVAPNRELTLFQSLCTDLPAESVAELRERVSAYLKELEGQRSRSELLAIDLARLVTDRLGRLLELMPQLTSDQRALVVGAARYFVSRDDAIPDTRACTGLDDDVRIVNHVLKELGRGEWSIEE